MAYWGAVVWFLFAVVLALWQLEGIVWKIPARATVDDAAKDQPDAGWGQTVLFDAIEVKWLIVLSALFLLSAFLGYHIIVQDMVTTWVDYAKLLVGFVCLISAAVIDFEKRIIPNILPVIMLSARVIFFVAELFLNRAQAWELGISSLVGGAASLAVFFVFSKLSRGGLGMGDVKLLAGYGFLCGTYAVTSTVFFALLTSVLFALLLLSTKRKSLKDTLPFAPFILVGNAVALILGIF